MRKTLPIVNCIIILCFVLMLPSSVKASGLNTESVFDYANLLSTQEENRLRDYSQKYEKYNISIIFLTIDNAYEKSSQAYSDDFYNSSSFQPDGILFMIDMDNREIYINTVGKCVDIISGSEIYHTLEDSYIYASNGEYYRCFEAMSKPICKTLQNYTNPLFSALKPSFSTILIMCIITFVVLAIIISCHYRANKKIPAQHYIGSSFRVLNRNTVYMGCRKEVLHNYYKKTEGSGGSSSHRSSGGVRHGGDGHKF